jgi:hypothetical protein
MEDYEKLGVFYLGKKYDLQAKTAKDELILYDSKDLVTHAVALGMTGSGKTGLCVALLEEAAIDGIPAIVIDPKGDLTNLLLTFPDLRGSDFLPWINVEDAQKKAQTPEQFAEGQAQLWSKGLADWGQSGERILRLRDAADFAVYTPGSSAGLPVSILKSFAAPDPAVLQDNELLRDRISVTATSLLSLLGIDADPIQSREHILLSTLFQTAWSQGRDLDLAALIQQIQTPPFTQVGVLDLESFYPAKDRFALVLALNGLLAAPGFGSWLEGVPLDVGQILHSAQGKPRVAIFSIAHLSDAERMFFVSLLFNQILGWMRAQSGTTSLRALVYMDEIFGYLPPVQNPPSKLPLMTLLKQARAFGVGIVLATQNPVDLDYKALSNTGTWFIGRLQTERDQARVLDGLEGAAATAGAGFDRAKMQEIMAGLGSRVFLMNNTHEDGPAILETRWTLSYLRGPLTRDQIKQLMDPVKASAAPAPANSPILAALSGAMAVPADAAAPDATTSGGPPALAAGIQRFFIPVRGSAPAGSALAYRPQIAGIARVRFADAKTRCDVAQDVTWLAPVTDAAVPVSWDQGREVAVAAVDLEKEQQPGAQFAPLPAAAGQAKNYAVWTRDLATWLYGAQKVDLLQSPSLGQVSNPGESERDFRVRLGQTAREQRDQAVEALRQRYAAKLTSLQDRIRRAQDAVDREAGQAKSAQMQTAISFGTTLLSALVGRKAVSLSTLGRATTAARGVGRAMKEQGDVGRATENVQALQQQYNDLEAELQAETDALAAKIDPLTETLQTVAIRPKKTDIAVQLVALVWEPVWQDAGGTTTPAWS